MKGKTSRKILSISLVAVMITSLCGYYVQADDSGSDTPDVVIESRAPDTEPSEQPSTSPSEEVSSAPSQAADTESSVEPSAEPSQEAVDGEKVSESDTPELTYQSLSRTMSDGVTVNVSGNLPTGVVLRAEITDLSLDKGDVLYAYDISLWLDGEEYLITEAVTVSFINVELPDSQSIEAYHVDGDNVEQIALTAVPETGVASMTAESFSIYALVGISKKFTSNYTLGIDQQITLTNCKNSSTADADKVAGSWTVTQADSFISFVTADVSNTDNVTIKGLKAGSATVTCTYQVGTQTKTNSYTINVTTNKYGYTGSINHIDIRIANALLDITQRFVDQGGDLISSTTKHITGYVSGVKSATLDLISGSDILVSTFSKNEDYEYRGTKSFNVNLSNLAGVSAVVDIKYTEGGVEKTLEDVNVAFTTADIKEAIENCDGFTNSSRTPNGIDFAIETAETLTGTQTVVCKLAVTKTFSGLSAAEIASLTDYAITVAHNGGTESYSLLLSDAAVNGNVYTWVLGSIKNGAYTVSESGLTNAAISAAYNLSTTFAYKDPFSTTNNRTGSGASVSNVSVSNGSVYAQVDFVNSYTPSVGTLTVTKSFSGNDSILPQNFGITVTDSAGQTHALALANAISGSAYTWTLTLPLGSYSVSESGSAIPGYTLNTAASTVSASGTLTAAGATAALTNSYSANTVSISGTKNWAAAPQSLVLPDSITIELLKNGQSLSPARVTTATAQDNWQYEFVNLPEYEGASPVVYSIRETAVSGTTLTGGRFIVYGTATGPAPASDREVLYCWVTSYSGSDITNTYVPAENLGSGSFSVQKYDSATEEPLVGATFTLSGLSDTAFVPIAQLTSTENAGLLHFSGLAVGTYLLTEAPPVGYSSAGPWTITVTEDGKTLLRVEPPSSGNVFTNIWNWVVNTVGANGYEDGTLTVYNSAIPTYTIRYNDNLADVAVTVPDNQIKTEDVAITLSDSTPAYTGHVFTGWNTKEDGSGSAFAKGAIYTDNKDLTLFAQWKDLIGFYINKNGEILDTVGSVQPRNPTEFSAAVFWGSVSFTGSAAEDSYNNTGDANVRAEFGSTGNLVLTGSFPTDDSVFTKLKELYTDGSSADAKKPTLTLGGNSIDWSKLDSLHYCIQWYVVKDQSDSWHVDGVIVDKTYTVTWVNGTTELEKDTGVPYNDPPTYNGRPPEKASTTTFSYTFDGWSTTDGGAHLETLPPVTQDVIYYAVYSPQVQSYQIRYQLDGSAYGTVQAKAVGAPGTVAAKAVVPGHTVTDWSTIDASVTDGSFTMPDHDVLFTATSVINTHSVSYSWTGTVPAGAPALPGGQTSVGYGTSVTVAAKAAGFSGSSGSLYGYWSVSDWSTPAATISDGAFSMPDTDVTLTAEWTFTPYGSYSVVYCGRGGLDADGHSTVSETPYTDSGYDIMSNDEIGFVWAGHSFIGWSTDPDGNDMVDVGENFDPLESGSTIYYYAQWRTNQYHVRYEFRGSVLPAGAIVPANGGSFDYEYPFVSEQPTAFRGYVFDGWYVEEDTDYEQPENASFVSALYQAVVSLFVIKDSEAPYVDGTPLVTNIVLYGYWHESVDYAVRYQWSGSHPSDAVLPETAYYYSGEPVAIASNPTSASSLWHFNGWTINGSPASNFNMGTAEVVITGSWSYYDTPIIIINPTPSTTNIPEESPPLEPSPSLSPSPSPAPILPTALPDSYVPGSDTPQTGDSGNIPLMAVLAVFGAAGLGTIGLLSRRKKRTK